MSKSLAEQIAELEQAIALQESLRPALDDGFVGAAVVAERLVESE